MLRLLVEGCSDREIAEALFISPRTAQAHVAHIFTKLNVSTRAAAVATALQAGLVPDRPAPPLTHRRYPRNPADCSFRRNR